MNILKKIKKLTTMAVSQEVYHEENKLLRGKLLVDVVKNKTTIKSLQEVEFKVFSQFGDDGIIQWLIHNLDIPNKTFIEFGVGNYGESNTRFLMMNDNWTGFVMDGSQENINHIRSSDYFWKYELEAEATFIDCENINDLILKQNFDKEVGILHIDLDGNDYWVWKSIDVIEPVVVIVEYNSLFGKDRSITIPYDKNYDRSKAHHSNLYFGVSLRALEALADSKGYDFIGCNSAGNNAYFVKRSKLNESVVKKTLEEGYVLSKFRESRDRSGNLNYLTGAKRLEAIAGMEVYNTLNGQIERL